MHAMRPHPAPGALAAAALATSLATLLAGCALPSADGKDEEPAAVELSFSYLADGGDGYIDQTLTITNAGGAAGAPDLDIVPLDADGEEVPGVKVVTAFGSDEGEQVVPAYTEVIDVLKFTGARRDRVADVRVSVADPGTLDADVPPANDIPVKRYDIDGRTASENTLGSVLVKNPYDGPITVAVVGLEFAPAEDGEVQHFERVSDLAGPITLQPGEKVREKVEERYQLRFFGAVRAFLVR
jgi:hypothetical protein